MIHAKGSFATTVPVFVLSAYYLGSAFQLARRTFWTRGLGDWIDPYFINFLLEHWYRSLSTFTDPSSPPMFAPIRGTLGYSHGLVLYAPFYFVLRPFFHPFQSYGLMLFVVIWTFGEIVESPSTSAFVADRAPEHARGRYQGALGMMYASAAVLVRK